MRMRAPARSSRPVVVITEPRVGARRGSTTTELRGEMRRHRAAQVPTGSASALRWAMTDPADVGSPFRARACCRCCWAWAPCWSCRRLARSPRPTGTAAAVPSRGRRDRRARLPARRAAAAGLRSTAESLAACAAGLALVGQHLGRLAARRAGPAAGRLAASACALRPVAPGHRDLAAGRRGRPRSWRVLRLSTAFRAPCAPTLFLAVALVGLGMRCSRRRLVARIALVTTAPWWIAGRARPASPTRLDRRTASPPRVAAALMVGRGGPGWCSPRLRRRLEPLLGPPRVCRVVAGAGHRGGGLRGAARGWARPASPSAGYAGVLIATPCPSTSTGWRGGCSGRSPSSGGGDGGADHVVAARRAARTGAQLALLLLLTAVPTGWSPCCRPDDARWPCPPRRLPGRCRAARRAGRRRSAPGRRPRC